MDKVTPCECPVAGYCKRHGVEKSAHLYKLCQSHIGYFNMWEECRGPKQNPNDCKKNTEQNATSSEVKEEVKLPTTIQMAKNFMKSAADHVKNGMKHVGEEKQKERLAICAECPYAIENISRCGKCGCFLQTKTKWESSSCPIGKW
jgi:hypothetical protein